MWWWQLGKEARFLGDGRAQRAYEPWVGMQANHEAVGRVRASGQRLSRRGCDLGFISAAGARRASSVRGRVAIPLRQDRRAASGSPRARVSAPPRDEIATNSVPRVAAGGVLACVVVVAPVCASSWECLVVASCARCHVCLSCECLCIDHVPVVRACRVRARVCLCACACGYAASSRRDRIPGEISSPTGSHPRRDVSIDG